MPAPQELFDSLGRTLEGHDTGDALLALAFLMAGALAQLTEGKYEEDALDEAKSALQHAYTTICNTLTDTISIQ